jgi:integrase
MAWLYQRDDSGRWWIGYRHHGKQILESTGQTDKAEASKVLAKVEAMLALERAQALTRGAFEQISGTKLPTKTLKAALDNWLAQAKASAGPRTVEKYELLAGELIKFFHATDQGPLASSIDREQLQQFLNEKLKAVSAETVNMRRKCLSVFFRHCRVIGATTENPMESIKAFKEDGNGHSKRRAFTLVELGKLYQQAPDDFWRFAVVAGFFTGLRLGDLVMMPVGAVDLKRKAINLVSRKTGAQMHIPLAPPLYKMLSKILAARKGAKPTDPIWPIHSKRYEKSGSGWFGQRFYDLLLVKAGMAPVRPHRRSVARTDKRKVNEISFHCFRHSYVSTLAALGHNQQIVKALAGHSGDDINDLYTKIPKEVLKGAIALLPDITKEVTNG